MEFDECSSSDSENDIIESDKLRRKKKFEYKLGNLVKLYNTIFLLLYKIRIF
jgi:hypothetical protein